MGRPLKKNLFGTGPGLQIILTSAWPIGAPGPGTNYYIVKQIGTSKYVVTNGTHTGVIKLVNGEVASVYGDSAGSGVSSIELTSGGSGYTSVPTISFTGGDGTGAKAIAFLTGTTVATVNVNSGGTGYTSMPTVTISGGNGIGATASARMKAQSVTIDDGGTGYTDDDVLTIVGGTSTAAATLTVQSTDGVVDSVVITNAGNYSLLPTNPVSVTGGSGNDDATFNINWNVLSVSVNNAGSGYTSVPAISFSGGGGTGAAATVNLTPTTVSSNIIVTNPGKNYNSAPTITISGGGGTDATAVASLGTPTVSEEGTGFILINPYGYGSPDEYARVIYSKTLKTFQNNVYRWSFFPASQEGEADLPLA